MKKLFGLTLFVASFSLAAQAQTSADNAGLQAKMAKQEVAGVKVGSLVCENAEGEMSLCSGDEYEKVLGFATSAPYVTVNKRPQGQNQDTFEGFASVEAGAIKEGDYVCAGANGTVKRCENAALAYGVAKTSASSEGQKITVRVLGNRR